MANLDPMSKDKDAPNIQVAIQSREPYPYYLIIFKISAESDIRYIGFRSSFHCMSFTLGDQIQVQFNLNVHECNADPKSV